MKFTVGERTTPARRVYDVLRKSGGASPYEVYRQTQLVASTRDAEWYCRELNRVGLIESRGSGWVVVDPQPADLVERLRQVHAPVVRGQTRPEESTTET